MKELVAFLICIPLLAPYMSQYTIQIVNDTQMDRVETIVNTAKEQARQEGYFTNSIIGNMTAEIKKAGFDEDEITVNVTTVPKYRTETFDERELIEYEVGVKIKKKIAANRLFGISDEDNQGIFTVRGAVASERLPG